MNGPTPPRRMPISWGSLILIGLISLAAANSRNDELKHETHSLQAQVRSLETSLDEQSQLLKDLYVQLVVAPETKTPESQTQAEANPEATPEARTPQSHIPAFPPDTY